MYADRDKLLRKLRQEHLDSILQRERQNMYKQHQLEQQQYFDNVYPHISVDNYQQHKYVLAQLVTQEKFTTSMIHLATLAYQYLVTHPLDADSILIIRYLSDCEDVRIPQTQDFVGILMAMMDNARVFDALLIIANLLTSSRYQMLRDRLVSMGFLDRMAKFVESGTFCEDKQKNSMAEMMMTQILCHMLCSQPLMDYQTLPKITRILKSCVHSQQQKWQIVHIFPKIRQKQKQNKKYAKLLVEEFEQLMVEERHGSKIQIMNFIIYAAYSGVFVDNQKILGIFLEVLEGKVGGLGMVGVDLALDCAGLYLEDRDIHIDAQPLWTILVNCKDNPNRRQSVLKVLDYQDEESLVSSLTQSEHGQKIIQQLICCMQSKQTEPLATETILKLLSDEKIKAQFQTQGFVKILEKMYEETDLEECGHLELLLDMFADNDQDSF